jgi:hypothetical protein
VRRSRRRQPTIPREGDLIIDGRVRARLLGLHLLDIDAQIVVAPARTAVAVSTVGSQGRAGSGRDGDREMHRRFAISPDAAAPPELAHAVRLIAEGSKLLDEAGPAR